MHLVTGKICCCFVDVSTHLMYFRRKQTTNCLSERMYWHVCRGRLGWRISSHQIIVISCLLHGLYEEITSLLPSGLLGLRGGFIWHHCDKHMIYEQLVMGNLANHKTWVGLILTKTTFHKSYLNGILMTQPVTGENIPFSAQETRCAAVNLE